MKSNIPAILFCGGHSQRMGKPKHLLALDDMPAFEYQIKRLKTAFNTVCISCRQDQVADFKDILTIEDKYSNIGPIAGIIACLEHFEGHDVLIVSVDSLSIQVKTLLNIAERNDSQNVAIVAADSETKKLEPLIARWNTNALEPLKNAVKNEEHSPSRFLMTHNHLTVHVPESELLNVNRPEDFERYLSQTKQNS